MTALEKARALVEHGMADSLDEAVHMLADMGEIDSDEHEELLSDAEAARVYGADALDAPYDADRPPGTSGSWGEA